MATPYLLFFIQCILLSSALATMIYSGRAENYCDGMICPPGTSCSVMSDSSNGVQVSRKTCTDGSGRVVKEEVSQGTQNAQSLGSRIYSDGMKTCIITQRLVNDSVNVTKLCRDETGHFRPMTAEEEEEFNRRTAEAEAEGRRASAAAQEEGRRMYEEGLRTAQEAVEMASRMAADATDQARRIGEEAAFRTSDIQKRVQEQLYQRQLKMEAQQRQHEARQEALERRLEQEQEQREEEFERRMAELDRSLQFEFPNDV